MTIGPAPMMRMVWMSVRYSRRSFPILRDVQQRVADVTTQAEEAIVGVRVIKAFAQEDRGWRIAVRDGVDIHASRYRNRPAPCQAQRVLRESS